MKSQLVVTEDVVPIVDTIQVVAVVIRNGRGNRSPSSDPRSLCAAVSVYAQYFVKEEGYVKNILKTATM